MSHAARSPFVSLAAGVVLGTLVTAGALLAQGKPAPAAPTAAAGEPLGAYEIVDTPGSTYLMNNTSGQVWRLSFTDVGGNKYWYAMHVPVQQPGSFEEFQAKLRRELAGQK